MPLQYYAAPETFSGGYCLLDSDEAHHLLDVARCRPGDAVRVFDGKGRAFRAEIAGRTPAGLSCRVLEPLQARSPALGVRLYFAPVSRQAVELILDQCTQLGAAQFHPVLTERSVSDVSKSWHNKRERWQALLLSACKQCGRADIPELFDPVRLPAALEGMGPAIAANPEESRLTPEEALKLLRADKPSLSSVSVVIGPEGGFSQEEKVLMLSCGLVCATLGPYVLRTETACAATCSALAQ